MSTKRNVILNFSSSVLPMAFGLAAIPLLIKVLGVERFGLLSIAWMIVGYFGVLDMGLGRALTQRVAYKVGTNEQQHIKSLVSAALLVVLLLGCVGAFALAGFAKYLVYEVFLISALYQEETLRGLYWVALTIPLVLLSTALFGALEGLQFFGWTAVVRAPLNILMFVAPLVAAYFVPSLDWALFSLLLVRLASGLALATIVWKQLRAYKSEKVSRKELTTLFSYGGWITVSNAVSPVMVYFDRFYIAAVIGASVVAYYTTPVDLLIKSLLLPLSLVGVMFAHFSMQWKENRDDVRQKFKISTAVVLAVMLPFCILIFLFAKFGLTLWLGESFAQQSYQVAQIIAVGIFFNAMAMVPYALIQAAGRADITAKFHLIELVFFVVILWWSVTMYGILGAAFAWSLRVFVDFVLLYATSYQMLKEAQ